MSDIAKVLPTIQGIFAEQQRLKTQYGRLLQRLDEAEARIAELEAKRKPGRPRKTEEAA